MPGAFGLRVERMSRRALTRLAVVAAIVFLIAGYFAIPPSADFDAEALVAKSDAYDVEIVRDALAEAYQELLVRFELERLTGRTDLVIPPSHGELPRDELN